MPIIRPILSVAAIPWNISGPGGRFHDGAPVRSGERSIPVYFEVPNVRFTLQDLAVWDIIYEHCAYFSQEALAIFRRCGFDVIDIQPTYEGQFLYIEARPPFSMPRYGRSTRGGGLYCCVPAADGADGTCQRFRGPLPRKGGGGRKQKLAQIRQAGQKVVIWGACVKGITFLNMLQSQGQIQDWLT